MKEIKPCNILAFDKKPRALAGSTPAFGTNYKSMKVYIAGKVSDLPVGEVFIKFSQAEYWLRLQGHETVNPLRLCSSDWTWERCMRVCLTELMKCDAICLLKDWGESRGAITEYYLASRLGMRMMVYKPSRNAGTSAVGRRNGDESTINKHQ